MSIDRLAAALSDRYAIERELGAGGMATVYLAHDLKHDRRVAVKVLRPELAAVIGAERFLAEIKTTANLQHPHILPLFDSGTVEGTVFYVMPFVDGESLRDRLTREKQLPVDDALRIAREVADALQYAHEHGVIHRDIKPENILLQGGHALVADFGIALAASKVGGARMTETGMSLGTPHYMSPEQAMGERELDARTDIYALGCVTYEMLAGEPPFTGPTAQAIVAKVVTEPAPSAQHKRATVPDSVDDAIRTALQKTPADRFRSAREFAAALVAVVPRLDRPAKRGTQPPSWRAFAITGAALVLMAAGAFLLVLKLVRGNPVPIASFGSATKITYDPGIETQPAISPDGRAVAYAAGPAGAWRIYIRQVSGGRTIPLTNDSTTLQSEPSWSADGSRIMFIAHNGVFSAPAAGGDPRPEVPAPATGSLTSAAWSPDGKSVAYLVGDSLWLWADQHRARLIAATRDLALCRWSPNGAMIACASGNPLYTFANPQTFGNLSVSRIVVLRVRDGHPTIVSDTPSLNQSPIWSPDSRWIYFISDRDRVRDIYAVRVGSDGQARSEPVRLTTGLGAQVISLSGDGSRLAYAAYRTTGNIWTLPVPASPPVTTEAATQLTGGDQVTESLVASRDGHWLLYDSDLSGRSQAYRIALPGGSPERLTTDEFNDFAPDLSPDGREIVFHSWRSGSRDIYVMPLDGGAVQQATSGPRQEMIASWSPDGRALAYCELSATVGGIWVARRNVDRSWGTPVQRADSGLAPRWSPDGRWLTFASSFYGGSISVLPADSGPARIIYDPTSNGGPSAVWPSWSGDGREIYFKHFDDHGQASFWSIPATGGTPRLLVRFADPSRPSYRPEFDVSHGRFYFTVDDRQSDIWVMEVRRP